MSSIDRPLAGPMLTFNLDQQLEEIRAEEAYERSGRSGRTLAKAGRFRLLIIAMAEGNVIGTHHAESPMTIQVLSGGIEYRTPGSVHALNQGEILFFGPGSAGDIRATETSALLITISAIGDDFDPIQF